MTNLRTGTPEQAGMHPEQIELIKQRGAQWVQQDNNLALAVLVARRGVICLHEAWGPRTPAPDAPPAEPNSIFPYMSVTKPITAAAIMMLVEDGLVGLTRPVQFYIPELLGKGADEILVHQLLTHTSGYDDDEDAEWIQARLAEGLDLPECPHNQHPAVHAQLHARYSLALKRAPGEQMSYASINYDLLGEIIRRVSSMSYADFLAQRIFKPLGMTSCTLGFDAEIEANMVCNFETPYWPGLPTGDEARALINVPAASGGIFGNIEDCAKFAQMLLSRGTYGNSALLSPASIDLMGRNQIPGIGTDFLGWHDEAFWSYGMDVYDTERWPWFGSLIPNGCYGHGGAGGVIFWVDPVNDLVGLYFSHCTDVDPETGETHGDFDLFQNMVTAAVAEE